MANRIQDEHRQRVALEQRRRELAERKKQLLERKTARVIELTKQERIVEKTLEEVGPLIKMYTGEDEKEADEKEETGEM
jgi:hypothetical protein